MLLKPVTNENEEPVSTLNPVSITQEIARAVYLEDILFGKAGTAQRLEILSFSELAIRLGAEELSQLLNQHLELKMFLVGHSITAADIFALTSLLEHWGALPDFEKIQLPHVFRWLDHVQHLPGLLEQVQRKGLLVSFPDENATAPSKGQAKKD